MSTRCKTNEGQRDDKVIPNFIYLKSHVASEIQTFDITLLSYKHRRDPSSVTTCQKKISVTRNINIIDYWLIHTSVAFSVHFLKTFPASIWIVPSRIIHTLLSSKYDHFLVYTNCSTYSGTHTSRVSLTQQFCSC